MEGMTDNSGDVGGVDRTVQGHLLQRKSEAEYHRDIDTISERLVHYLDEVTGDYSSPEEFKAQWDTLFKFLPEIQSEVDSTIIKIPPEELETYNDIIFTFGTLHSDARRAFLEGNQSEAMNALKQTKDEGLRAIQEFTRIFKKALSTPSWQEFPESKS